MNIHPLVKMSQREALLYAAVCEMYAEDGEQTTLEVDDKGDLFMSCKAGVFTVWHGLGKVEEWMNGGQIK